MAPKILVSGAQRMTPAYYPVSVVWKEEEFDSFWKDDGYHLHVLCRGAHFHAKEIICELPCKPWRGWTKTRGSLWLKAEGVYEVRSEIRDDTKEEPKVNPFVTHPGIGTSSHLWTPYDFDEA